jgi:purine-nucleoside phosphorylase
LLTYIPADNQETTFMLDFYAQIATATDYIRSRIPHIQPAIGLILGSGLGMLADDVSDATIIPYADIPGFAPSTVIGHAGRLVIGSLAGKPVLVMAGRLHFYEGYSLEQTTFPIRVMHALGISTLLVTNAAGGLNPAYRAGDIMLIADHLNIPGMAGNHPLRGPNDERLGPRFPAMNGAYDPALRARARAIASRLNIPLQEGVYIFISGPSYETPAEVRMLRILGADAVGMSTVPEVIVARHSGMRVLGLSTITNVAIADEAGGSANHEEVLETATIVGPRLRALVAALVAELKAEG